MREDTEEMNLEGDLNRIRNLKALPRVRKERPAGPRPVRLASQDFVELYLDQLRRRAGWARPRRD